MTKHLPTDVPPMSPPKPLVSSPTRWVAADSSELEQMVESVRDDSAVFPKFEPGTLIDSIYRTKDTLGRGGMGVVMRARDERLERDVAIKLIRPELIDETIRARFLSEARAMARVHHPNVLPIYAFGESDGVPYLVTELVEGGTVEHWLGASAGAPDVDTALRILDETCRGVSAIHAASTIHRDLKPSNLLLGEDLRVRVADMGIADLLQRVSSDRQAELVGTPEYMAPENVRRDEVAPELVPRADVYSSLGELLSQGKNNIDAWWISLSTFGVLVVA